MLLRMNKTNTRIEKKSQKRPHACRAASLRLLPKLWEHSSGFVNWLKISSHPAKICTRHRETLMTESRRWSSSTHLFSLSVSCVFGSSVSLSQWSVLVSILSFYSLSLRAQTKSFSTFISDLLLLKGAVGLQAQPQWELCLSFPALQGRGGKNIMDIILAPHLNPCVLLPGKKRIFGNQKKPKRIFSQIFGNQQKPGAAALYVLVNSLGCLTLPETSHGHSQSIPRIRISVTDT